MTQALNALPAILPPHALDIILRATIAVTGWLCMAWRLSGCATDARATGGTTATTVDQGRPTPQNGVQVPYSAFGEVDA